MGKFGIRAYSGENDHVFRAMSITQTGHADHLAARQRWQGNHTANWSQMAVVSELSS